MEAPVHSAFERNPCLGSPRVAVPTPGPTLPCVAMHHRSSPYLDSPWLTLAHQTSPLRTTPCITLGWPHLTLPRPAIADRTLQDRAMPGIAKACTSRVSPYLESDDLIPSKRWTEVTNADQAPC